MKNNKSICYSIIGGSLLLSGVLGFLLKYIPVSNSGLGSNTIIGSISSAINLATHTLSFSYMLEAVEIIIWEAICVAMFVYGIRFFVLAIKACNKEDNSAQ